MKIIKIISVMFIAVFVLSGSVMAYSTDAYSIEVPSTYIDKSAGTSTNPTIFNKETSTEMPNFNVYLKDNTDSTNIKNASSKDISQLATEICSQIYNSYGVKVDIIQQEKTSLNGYDAIFLSLKWNSKSTVGYDIYQNQYIMTSKKYLYTLTFTADNTEELGSSEIATIKSSFVIKDDLLPKGGIDLGEVLRSGIIGAIVAVIVGFVVSKIKGQA